MNTIRLLSLLLSASTITAFGQTSGSPAGSAPASSPSADAGANAQDKAVNTASYLLQPTDTISIIVADDDRANKGSERIAKDGTINLVYITEPIKVSGMTIPEAINAIKAKYIAAKIFKNPQISIGVVAFAERRVYVTGKVNAPGWVLIPPEEELTLVTAITRAGGPGPLAAAEVTINRRKADGTSERITRNLKDAIKNAKYDFPLQDGDTIHVPESWIGSVY